MQEVKNIFERINSLLIIITLLLTMAYPAFVPKAYAEDIENTDETQQDDQYLSAQENDEDLIQMFQTQFLSGAIFNDSEYVWEAGEDNSSGHVFVFRTSYGLHSTEPFSPRELKITLPLHILKNRQGEWADKIELALPTEEESGRTDNNLAYRINGDTVEIFNIRELSPTEAGNFEFSYSTTNITSNYTDLTKSENLNTYMSVNKNGAISEAESNGLYVVIDTNAKIKSTKKEDPKLYKKWQDSWGLERPEDHEDYYYCVWEVNSTIGLSQPYDFELTDEFIIDGGSVIGYKFFTHSSFQESNIVENQTYNERCDFVLTRQPKSTYAALEDYTLSNRVISKVIPIDNNENSSAATSLREWFYQKPIYSSQPGLFSAGKYGQFGTAKARKRSTTGSSENISDYSLTEFRVGDKDKIEELSFYIPIVGYPAGWTLEPGADPENPENYHKANVKYETTDENLYLDVTATQFNNHEEQPLSYNSYDLKRIELSYKFFNGEYDEDIADFRQVPVETYKDTDMFYLYLKTDGDYFPAATYHFATDTWTDVDYEHISSVSNEEISLKDGVKGFKTEFINSFYYVRIGIYPVITLYRSDEVIDIIGQKTKVTLSNKQTTNVYTEDGRKVYSKETDGKGASDFIIGTVRDSDLKTRVESTYNDKINKQYEIEWISEMKETYRQNDGEHNVEQEGGSFYVLLPIGSDYKDGSAKLYNGEKEISKGKYNIETISNYKNTGQTLLVVKTETAAKRFSLKYTTIHTYENVKDYGKSQKVEVAYETGNEQIINGHSDDGGSLTHKEEMSSLTNPTHTLGFLYSETDYLANILMASSIGLSLKVKSSKDSSYRLSTSVGQDETYSYQFRLENDPDSLARDIVFFNSIETLTKDDDDIQWKGKLKGINTVQLEAKDIAVKIYLSRIENLNVSEHNNLKEELEGNKVWIPIESFGDISEATAIAIDCRRKTDGTDFILGKSESISIPVFMESPHSVQSLSENPTTYNNIFCKNILINNSGAEFDNWMPCDFTSVSIRVKGNIKILKVEDGDSSTTIPNVEFSLKGTSIYGTDIATSKATNSDGQLVFKDIERGQYYLIESFASNDYIQNKNAIPVEINESGDCIISGTISDGYYEIKNTPRKHGDLVFYKIDKNGGKTRRLKGVEFRLSGKSEYGNDVLKTAISDSEGRVYFDDIELGTYLLTEITPLPKYIKPSEKWTVKVDKTGEAKILEVNPDEFGDYYIENEKYIEFSLEKQDASNPTLRVSGAKFQLSGTSNYNRHIDFIKTTDINGILTFSQIEPGNYILQEIEAPENYDLDKTKRIVTIAADHSVSISGLDFDEESECFIAKNSRSLNGQIRIVKIWKDNLTNEQRPTPIIHISTKEAADPTPIARIDRELWNNYFDPKKTTIKRIVPAQSLTKEEVIAMGGVKIDDGEKQRSVYVYSDGNTVYIWTDAQEAYMDNPKQLLYGYSSLEYCDISNIGLRLPEDGTLSDTTSMFANDKKLQTVVFGQKWRMETVKNTESMFEACEKLSVIEGLEDWEMPNVQKSTKMFYNCKSLAYSDFSAWGMDSLKNATQMFQGYGINNPGEFSFIFNGWNTENLENIDKFCFGSSPKEIDLRGWNTTNLKSLDGAFKGVEGKTTLQKLSHIYGLEDLDLSNAINIHDIISHNINLVQSFDLSGWNISNKCTVSRYAFSNSGITSIDVTGWNMLSMSDFRAMFFNCPNLTDIYGLESWDVRNGVQFDLFLKGDISLKNVDLSTWNTEKAISIAEFFTNCSCLEYIDLSSWNPKLCTNFSNLFYECNSLEKIDGVENWNVSKLKNTSFMFCNCYNLESVNISTWTPSEIEDISSMFYNCYKIKDIDTSSWILPNLKKMNRFLYYCHEIEEINLSGFNTAQVNNFTKVFAGCYKLREIKGIEDLNVNNVTSFESLFHFCQSISSLDLSSWDINKSKTINMNNMFNGMHTLTTIGDISSWGGIKPSNMSHIFANCYLLDGINISEWDVYAVQNMGNIFSDCHNITYLDLSNWNTHSLTVLEFAFTRCYNLQNIGVDNWDVSQVASLECTFQECHSLKNLNVSNWNVKSLTNMGHAFYSCSSLQILDLSSWKTNKLNRILYAFGGCEKIKRLDCQGFDVSDCESFQNTFLDTKSIENINVSTWNTSNVKNFSRCFSHVAESAEPFELDLSSFNTSAMQNEPAAIYEMFAYSRFSKIYVSDTFVVPENAKTSTATFYNCKDTVGQNGFIWDKFKTSAAYARIDTPGTPGYFSYKEFDGEYYTAQDVLGATSINALVFSSQENTQDIEYTSDDSLWEKNGNVWTYTFNVFDDSVEYYVYEEFLNNYISDGYWENERKVGGLLGKEMTITNEMNGYVPAPEQKYGSIKITKDVFGENLLMGVNGKALGVFNFEMQLLGDDDLISGTKIFGDYLFVDGKTRFSLSDGDEIIFTDIPEGLTYYVEEEPSPAYSTSIIGNNGTVIGDKEEIVKVENTKLSVKKYNSFALSKKTVNGIDGDEFTFTITMQNLEKNATYLLSDNSVFRSDSDGFAEISVKLQDSQTIKVLNIPIEATYKIIEEESDYVASYTIIDGKNLGKITSPIDRNDQKNKPLSTSTEKVDEGEEIAILFTNERAIDSPQTKSIAVEKTWEGDNLSERPLSIQVLLYQNNDVISSKEIRGADGWKESFENLPIYDVFGSEYIYRIEEIPVNGYDISYNVEEGKTIITNTKTGTGNLFISKKVEGNASDPYKQFRFEITLRDRRNQPFSGSFEYTGSKSGTISFVDGEGSLYLKHNEDITIKDIPEGFHYKVEEMQDMVYIPSPSTPYIGLILKDTTIRAPFLNIYNIYTDFRVSNYTDGDKDKSFTFEIQIKDDGTPISGTYLCEGVLNEITFVEGEATITLKDNESLLIKDLLVGLDYEVVETHEDHYFQVSLDEKGRLYKIRDENYAIFGNILEGSLPKIITNSTQNNQMFTESSSEDLIDFEIRTRFMGNEDIFNEVLYKMSDIDFIDTIDDGLTYVPSSVQIKLYKDNSPYASVSDFTTKQIGNQIFFKFGEDTFSQVAAYAADEIVITYSAYIDSDAIVGSAGNTNTASLMTINTNKNKSFNINGNSVYAYTYDIEVEKTDDNNNPLAGSVFAIYNSAEDAASQTNEIARGTSDENGLVEFIHNDIIKHFASGKYYIVEIEAANEYNRFTEPIEVTLSASYGSDLVNGTYVTSEPQNGKISIKVMNSKAIIPNAGGHRTSYLFISVLLLFLTVFAITLKNKMIFSKK